MDRDAIFTDLLAILEQSAPDVDTREMVLDDRPFADHGIDSMLMLRLVGDVEAKFDIAINDSDVLLAFSFARLVDLIAERTAAAPAPGAQRAGAGEADFLAAVTAAARAGGAATTVRFLGRDHEPIELPHQDFLRAGAWLGRGLPESLDGSRTVLVAATEPMHILLAFFAALSRGARPLILPTPKSIGGPDAFHERIALLVAGFARTPTLVVHPRDVPDTSRLPAIPTLELPTDLADYGRDPLPQPVTGSGPDDIAFLQMTSASTGDARLVGVSHANVCSNLAALAESLGLSGPQRTFSWLPLYHDMGLVGGALFALFNGFCTTLMKPTDFVRSPGRWIRGMSDERATFSGAPNFALDYAAQAIPDHELVGVDLSPLRRVGVAAEPIHRDTVQRFVNRFAPYGLRPDSLVPGLGLAESTLATTTRPGADPRYLVLASGGAAVGESVPVLAEGFLRYPQEPPRTLPDGEAFGGDGVAVFSLGTAIGGLAVGLQDDDGRAIDREAVLGEIVVTGSSVCGGYYDPTAERPVPFEGAVLRTGDLGFLHRGELFVLDRRKNVIIRRGANFSASLLEHRVAEILDIPTHVVMVLEEDISVRDSPVHVVVENAQDLPVPDDDRRMALRRLDLPVDVVTYARGFALPRTTSGKKRYHVCRRMLAAGELPVVTTVRL
jgi:acyl-CoA synthetase (AMP-forming)/AMP-acid ligase II/acyl carrier protein